MRIGIAINKAWNIYNFRKGIIKSLIQAGHDVVAIAPPDEYVDRIRQLGCEFVAFPLSDTGTNPITEVQSIFRLHQLLKKQKIDILLTYTIKVNLYGTLAARWNRIPIICNVSGLGTAFLAKTPSAWIAKKMSGLILNRASHIFFQNPDDQRDFLKETGMDQDKSSLIPGSGIDLEAFGQDVLQLPADYQFVMLSRLIIEKGVVEYGEAAGIVKEKYPEVSFLLVGSLDKDHARSIDKARLDGWVEKGYLDYLEHLDDISSVIRQSEVVVLPSYREGTPRVLLEGAALGRPLITTDTPGCREVVRHGMNGFLCEIKSAASLAAQCMHYLSLDDAKKRNLGEKGRELVAQKFDEKIVINAYMDKINVLTL